MNTDTSFQPKRIRRTTLLKVECPFEANTGALDAELLRNSFATLFEQAAEDVQRAGRDVDEVVFERFLRCRKPEGDSFDVPADWLSDTDRLVSAIREGAGNDETTDIHIESLRVMVMLEEWT